MIRLNDKYYRTTLIVVIHNDFDSTEIIGLNIVNDATAMVTMNEKPYNCQHCGKSFPLGTWVWIKKDECMKWNWRQL